MIAVSVVFTLVTGDATTSCDTSQGESLLNDGVNEVWTVPPGSEGALLSPFVEFSIWREKVN